MGTVRAVGGIQIDGIKELRRQLDPAVFNRTMRIANRRAAGRVQSESRRIIPGTIFDRAIWTQMLPGGLGAIVFTPAKAGESIHEGRPAGTAPTYKALKRWIRTYGLAGSVSIRTRRVRTAKSVAPTWSAVNQLAGAVRAKILRRGTKPIPFLAGAIGPARGDVERYWREALVDSVKHFAGRRKVA